MYWHGQEAGSALCSQEECPSRSAQFGPARLRQQRACTALQAGRQHQQAGNYTALAPQPRCGRCTLAVRRAAERQQQAAAAAQQRNRCSTLAGACGCSGCWSGAGHAHGERRMPACCTAAACMDLPSACIPPTAFLPCCRLKVFQLAGIAGLAIPINTFLATGEVASTQVGAWCCRPPHPPLPPAGVTMQQQPSSPQNPTPPALCNFHPSGR